MILTEQEIIRAKNVNNVAWIDIGDTKGYSTKKTLDGNNSIIIVPNKDFSGFAYLKRSGKVLNTPKRFYYTKPYNPRIQKTIMSVMIRHPLVKKDDIVFFDPRTKGFCEEKSNGLVFKTEKGNYVYAVPYRFLICLFRKHDNKSEEIVMLNGNVMVKRKLELINDKYNSDIIITPEKEFDTSEHNWCEVTEINNDEGLEGVFVSPFGSNPYYHYWHKKDQNLNRGMFVLVKKHSSFELQNATMEVPDIDRLQDVFAVERHKIIAFKETKDSVARPYGFYLKVELDKKIIDKDKDFIKTESGIWLKSSFDKYYAGKIVDIGCGVHSWSVGSNIRFLNKTQQIQIIDNCAYIHDLWLESSVEVLS